MEIIKQKQKGILTVISGPSGAGKDNILNEVIKRNNINAWVSISMTSRSPRGTEENGKEYFFVSKEQFEDHIKKDDFLEYAEYNGNYYGTPKNKIEDYLNKGIDVILIIEIKGALQIKNLVPEALFIFIMPPSMKELKQRLISRGTIVKKKLFPDLKSLIKRLMK